ncbi:hypothetical protein NC796_09335 [Aliifodinibius sp. S!AR15-10]|uniref:hypothetical protein n=1 Tax=Aliifodinibius sp. S!AR15-10 TaxID=2950437 RepID=UPI00285FD3A6|nr:hypothetical protein [Aliifodinibius sp. S!AR15-10]MDR8391339.1 hypothetical protein [Aliifodinibius sp. S!AR15-10]
MKTITKYITLSLLSLFVMAGSAFAQFTSELQYYTYQDQRGLNVFEAPFTTNIDFDGVAFKIGGANTLQFQGLNQSNNGAVPLSGLESNFNLATSNLDLDVALDSGLRMHLRTYLTSRHHTEPYVKSGYFQIDRLDFIKEGFLSEVMDKVRIKIGHMEINYGDTHFRRSDNGSAILNPFVGNYIMDSFSTEVSGELYYFDNGILAMVGLSNGKLNQSTVASSNKTTPNLYGKLGYDKQVNENLRFRLTGSVLTSSESASLYLYSGDRAGSRYYGIFGDSFTSGRFAPDYTVSGRAPGGPISGEMTSFMLNPFIKLQGLELFGVYEAVSGKLATESESRSYDQYGAELLYRFGAEEDFYLGGRFNQVSGELASGDNIDITRFNVGGGWFLTKNILAKVEYVTQQYDGFAANSMYADGEFNGVMMEAVISF